MTKFILTGPTQTIESKINHAIASLDAERITDLFTRYLVETPELYRVIARIKGHDLNEIKVMDAIQQAVVDCYHNLLGQAKLSEDVNFPFLEENNLTLLDWIGSRAFGTEGKFYSGIHYSNERSEQRRQAREEKFARLSAEAYTSDSEENKGEVTDISSHQALSVEEHIDAIINDKVYLQRLVSDYLSLKRDRLDIMIWYLRHDKEINAATIDNVVQLLGYTKKEHSAFHQQLENLVEMQGREEQNWIKPTVRNIMALLYGLTPHKVNTAVERVEIFLESVRKEAAVKFG